MIHFIVHPLEMVGKQRARICANSSFTPSKTINAEKEIINEFTKHINEYKEDAIRFRKGNIPLVMVILFVFVKPKSAKKRIFHTVKPDIDNLCKLVMDALNPKKIKIPIPNIAIKKKVYLPEVFANDYYPYLDDTQIVKLITKKEYGDRNTIDIIIREYGKFEKE
jgi:Holliday junction resolvase RusA-like endonuclease